MRWFVEVSRIGENSVAEEYCVQAKQWQAALQEARKLRGDRGALSQFSIELLDHGYRAVDPTLKLRYLVTQAPETARLTGSSTPSGASFAPSVAPVSVGPATTSYGPPSSSHAAPRPSANSAPRPSYAPRSQQLLVPSDPVPPPPALSAAAGLPVASLAESEPGKGSLPSFELIRERSEEPRADSPITYRELAFAVTPGVTRHQVEALLMDRYLATVASVEGRPPGKFVQLAVFDHVFKRRPERPPLATFAWKDWRGAPVLAFPGFGEAPMGPLSQVPPAPSLSSYPPPNGVHERHSLLPGSAARSSQLPLPAASLKGASPEPSERPQGSLAPLPILKVEMPRSEPASVAPLTPESAPVVVTAPTPQPVSAPLSSSPVAAVAPSVADAAAVSAPPPAESAQLQAPTVEALSDAAAPSIAAPALAELAPVIAESVPASAEPAPLIAAPTPLIADPAPTAAPAPVIVEPAPEVVEPAPLIAEPASAIAEPTPAITESAPLIAEPTLLITEPALPIAEPAPVLAEPTPLTADPAPAAALAPVTVEPGSPTAEPALGFELNFESAPQPVAATTVAAPSAASRERVSRPRPASGRRRAGEDLISELFEVMHELHFQRDVATGAEFVLSVLDEVMPCEGVLIHVFDINTGQFVVVRAKGPNARSVLLQRMSDQDPFVASVMRSPRSILLPNAGQDSRFNGSRWKAVGVTPKSALCGAVHLGGRYLGLIELTNPHGGTPFHFSELNALDYICEQFADFLSKKPVVLAADVVLSQV